MRPAASILACILMVTPASAASLKIVALGDSLTAGYGVESDQSFPAQLEARLKEKGHDVTVVNAGVSGDTAAQGLARLDWAIGDGADGVIVELGANDMLRGFEPAQTRSSLEAILAKLRAKKIPVLLAGMRAAPNLGASYAETFDGIYPGLAAAYASTFYPFFLEGVTGQPSLNLEDGIHPNANGIEEVVKRILPSVEHLIATIETSRKQPTTN